MPQLSNTNEPYRPKMSGGGRGLVQYVSEGALTGALFGSLNGVDYHLIHSFTESDIKELALPPYVIISGAVDNHTTPVTDGSKCYLNETR